MNQVMKEKLSKVVTDAIYAEPKRTFHHAIAWNVPYQMANWAERETKGELEEREWIVCEAILDWIILERLTI